MDETPTARCLLAADGAGPTSGVDRRPRPRPARQVFEGRWATLEPLTEEHIHALGDLAAGAPASWAWLPYGPFPDTGTFEAYARMAASSRSELIWAVRPHGMERRPGPAAGWLALLDIQPHHAAIELGNIWFPPGLARTQAATEAMGLLLGHAFELGYRRVAWKCDARHVASRRAAERLGFRFEGLARAHMIVRGRRRDTAYYSLLDEEWPDRREALSDWLDPRNFDPAGRARAPLRRPP